MTPTPPTDVADFYDAIAPFYDDMTGTRERIVRDEKTFDSLVHSNKISDALDAGTGSGAHTLLLARLGVNMTGIDIAPAMIDRLTRNAAELGLSVTGLVAPMQNLPTSMNESFDAVFCLGNTFPHLRSSEERRSAVQGFYRVLRPGGLVILQFLNFDMIRPDSRLPRFLTQVHTSTMERRYEPTAEGVRLVIRRNDVAHADTQTFSLDLLPVRPPEMLALLESEGFTAVSLAGDLSGGAWNPETSHDIVVTARKSPSRQH